MSKPYYSDYVKHAMRFYSRNCSEKPVFKSEADKRNWLACDIVLKGYPLDTRAILTAVYGGYDTLPDEVYNTAKKWHIDQNWIWDMMKEVERKIARKRGLI